MEFEWTDRRKKKILYDIIANVEKDTTLKEIKEDFEDGTGISVSMKLVNEATEEMERKGKIELRNNTIHPK